MTKTHIFCRFPTKNNRIRKFFMIRYSHIKFRIPVKVLAPLLCPKDGIAETPFEIKIDNYCFAGFPLRIENSAHSLAVGFVLPGIAPSSLISSFQKLSKKIAIAINSEQKRCDYLRKQVSTMQPVIEEYEVESLANSTTSPPYPAILGTVELLLGSSPCEEST